MSSKLYEWFREGGRIPRKLKKQVLGKKMKRKVLRHMLKTLQFGPPIVTMWDRRECNHGLFCPNCGERDYRGTGNMTEYPEHWEYFYCIRCRKKVGEIDNSPFYHVLEYKDI